MRFALVQGCLNLEDIFFYSEVERVLSAFAFSDETLQDGSLVLSDGLVIHNAEGSEEFQVLDFVGLFLVVELLVEMADEPLGDEVLDDQIVSFKDFE